jgi:zinc and cadmium transporter
VTSLAVAAHEIPQEVGDLAILLHSGYSRRRAFTYNVAVSFTTVAGALCAFVGLSQLEAALPYVLAVAASSFIYVAVADLIPGLHARTELRDSVHQVSLMVLGIGLVYALDRALH